MNRPFVRFLYEGSHKPVDVVETAETDKMYQNLQPGDIVDLNAGGTATIQRRVFLGIKDIVFYCK